MKPEETEKQMQIVDAAIKRFSHFGIAKTTLAEIADDVGLSRQSFFYYYHDKNELIAAVIIRIFAEFISEAEQQFNAAETASQALLSILHTKEFFFKKYALLALQDNKFEIIHSENLKKIQSKGRKRMIALLSKQIERGMATQEFRTTDSVHTARLILEMLTAYEHAAQYNAQGFVAAADFTQLIRRQKEALQLVVSGLQAASSTPLNHSR